MSTNQECENKIAEGYFNFSRVKLNNIPEEKDKVILEYSNIITEAEKCMKLLNCNTSKEKLHKQLAVGYNERGFMRYLKVDFKDAVKDYTKALSYDSSLFYTYYNRGLIHYRLGRFDDAVDDMTRSLTLKSDFEPAKKCLQQTVIDRQAKQET